MTWRGRCSLGRTDGVGTSIQPDRNTPAYLNHRQSPTSQHHQTTLPEPWLTGALSAVDTTSADGRLFFQIIAAMAEFERSLIKDRTKAGLEAAKAQGRTGGRPTVVTDDLLAVARARKGKGESISAIAKALGVSRATLYRHLSDYQADTDR